MSVEGFNFYPGDQETPRDVIALADQYRRSAQTLRADCRPGKRLSSAPFRLVCIQAIELYLNAFMLSHGCAAKNVRGMNHNLSQRALFAKTKGFLSSPNATIADGVRPIGTLQTIGTGAASAFPCGQRP